jgi:hypothetical protein
MLMGMVGFEEEFLKVSDPLKVNVGVATRSTKDYGIGCCQLLLIRKLVVRNVEL